MVERLVCALLCLTGLAGQVHAESPMTSQRLALVPLPVAVVQREGKFEFNRGTKVVARGAAVNEARKLIGYLAPAMDFTLEFAEAAPADSPAVRMELEEGLESNLGVEGYCLSVSARQIVMRAAGSSGLFYAVQTLRQLLPPQVFSPRRVAHVAWTVPCVEITDHPRFGWRGLLIDPARHFIPKSEVLKFLDVMAAHKLNRLQVHFTDDQGWRIEIKKYPRLTEVGAWRDETLVGHMSQKPWKFDGQKHGGAYTQDDLREIVEYAAQRHITIVPEVEMPGHARAAIASYPHLGVFPEQQQKLRPWTRWGISEDILAPRPQTIAFCKDVLTEIMAIFPSRYIHIGGDEAVKTQWKASQEIQQMIRDQGLRDESELQAWFTKQINAFLTERGRRLVGWDEILEGGLAPGAVVMSWRGEKGGIAAAQSGHDVVMAPTSHTYLDYYQGPRESEPLAIGGNLPLETVYRYEPVPAALSPDQAKHVLGAQAQLWSEYIPDAKQLEYMAYPRACAICEVLWSPRQDRRLDSFLPRLRSHLQRLDAASVNYRRP